jgi:hypothetical protein
LLDEGFGTLDSGDTLDALNAWTPSTPQPDDWHHQPCGELEEHIPPNPRRKAAAWNAAGDLARIQTLLAAGCWIKPADRVQRMALL